MSHNTDAFEALCRIEPRLHELLERAKQTPAAHWYAHFEGGKLVPGLVEELEMLVGFSAEEKYPDLTTSLAYDTAYQVIHGAMKR